MKNSKISTVPFESIGVDADVQGGGGGGVPTGQNRDCTKYFSEKKKRKRNFFSSFSKISKPGA